MQITQKQDLLNAVHTIEKIVTFLSKNGDAVSEEKSSHLFGSVMQAVSNVNKTLFNSETINQYKISNSNFSGTTSTPPLSTFIEQCQAWTDFIKNTIETRYLQNTALDEQFLQLLDYVTYVDYDIILQQSKESLHKLSPDIIDILNRHYQTWEHMWKRLDTNNNCYDVLEERIHNLIEHRDDFKWLYNHLGDYRSKLVLHNMLYNWLTFNPSLLLQMREGNYADYYDLDLLNCDENEVVVDLGAFDGDSTKDYIQTYQKYKRIYCYEITKSTADLLAENLKDYPNIEIRNKGAGAESDIMYVSSSEVSSSNMANKEKSDNVIPVEIVSIDEDITEPVTLIKMDIEGAEQSALTGCRRHIVEERPKLLICVYHNNEDIYKIPNMIAEMRNDYTYYLRSNGLQYGPAEIVLFAL
ncbi:MAG: FkbM family methyltransferase [Clostridium sp.]|nr:FkbM family methyltransferase [Clostridium sp.]MCM1399746.1 FkbM family methyltransferase [Clostridium sp.]MCM1460419.1 FkbM family methyltransferase [Bacteroides sp.]